MKAPAPGQTVFRRFVLIKPLSLAPERLVFLCRDTVNPDRSYALKLLSSEEPAKKAAAFWREAEFGRRIKHPNVVRCYERFENECFLGYSMEYVSGVPLSDLLAQGTELPLPYVIKLLHQLCLGLQAVHDNGIVHRDIKPDNILLSGGTHQIKITDFGIAMLGHGKCKFSEGSVYGTIPYLSPEYVSKGDVDARSDLYALGVVAYQMLTGSLPFAAHSDEELLQLKVSCDPVSPALLRDDCPQQLSDLVMTCLQRDPVQRYQSAQQIGIDLIACDYPPEFARFIRSGYWPEELLVSGTL